MSLRSVLRPVGRWVVCVAVLAASAPALGEDRRERPTDGEVPAERICAALNEVAETSTEDAAEQIPTLRAAHAAASGQDAHVLLLLLAATLERAGETGSAKAAYTQLMIDAKGTPYAASAAYRLRQLGLPKETDKIEEALETLAEEPPKDGWFLAGQTWTWGDTRRAALTALVQMRSDRLSFRFLDYLRDRAPFPPSYAYLFALVVLTLGSLLLSLPLRVRAAISGLRIGWLRPEIQLLQSRHRLNPQAMQRELLALYKRNNVNVWAGCSVFFVELVFIIWALVTMNDYAPRLRLDGAAFLWIADVTQYDFSIILAWMVLSLVMASINQVGQGSPQTTRQAIGGGVFASGLIMAVAWYWAWPAYVFVFWTLLTGVGSAAGLLLRLILLAVMRKPVRPASPDVQSILRSIRSTSGSPFSEDPF